MWHDKLREHVELWRAGAINATANWRTSATGLAMVFGGLADILNQFASGQWDGGRLWSDVVAISAGVGLLCAKDSAATKK